MIWEYKTVKLSVSGFDYDGRTVEKVFGDIENALNEVGQDGWELVSTIETDKSGYIRLVLALFKRPKKSPPLDENLVVPVKNAAKPRTTQQISQYNI